MLTDVLTSTLLAALADPPYSGPRISSELSLREQTNTPPPPHTKGQMSLFFPSDGFYFNDAFL